MSERLQTYEDRMALRAAWPIRPRENRMLRKITPQQLRTGYFVFVDGDHKHRDYGFYYLADDGQNYIVEEPQ